MRPQPDYQSMIDRREKAIAEAQAKIAGWQAAVDMWRRLMAASRPVSHEPILTDNFGRKARDPSKDREE